MHFRRGGAPLQGSTTPLESPVSGCKETNLLYHYLLKRINFTNRCINHSKLVLNK